MSSTIAPEQHYLDEFARLEREFIATGPSWLHSLRRAALARFAETGFPDRRNEDWKYTQFARVTETAFQRRAGVGEPVARTQTRAISGLRGARIVFVDGVFSAQDSELDATAEGISVTSVSELLQHDPESLRAQLSARLPAKGGAFPALNAAFFSDGVVLRVPAGVRSETTIQFIHVTTSAAAAALPVHHLRNAILLERGAQAQFVEKWLGEPSGAATAGSLTNSWTEVLLEDGAVFDHVKLECEDPRAQHIAALRVSLGRGSAYTNHYLSAGAGLARNEIEVSLAGEESHCTLNGLFVAGSKRHVDCHTVLQHLVPNCRSWEVYRGILGGHASGVFRGRINVHANAQKTDAKQSSRSLLLSADATMNTKPCLEIYADDVKCTHGATIGELDAIALFYLRSRGLNLPQATNMLVHAFASEVLEAIAAPEVRAHATEILESELRALQVGAE